MGILDIFQKKEKQNESFGTIKIGDWVTQYSAGYWMVVYIFPKYADDDYSNNGHSWKKGDRIGEWVILKRDLHRK